MNVPPNEVVTTESTCYGDSGGPLVDSLGQIVAVASRGLDDLCVDRPTFWTTFALHEQLIRSAASSVGHPLAEASPPPRRGTTNAASGSSGGAAGSVDDAVDDADESTGARPRRSGAAVASAGCATTPGRTRGFDWIALGLVLGLVSRTRRRRV